MASKNKLGVFDFTMIVVSLVIGMGIFRTPANVAAASPTPLIFFIAWIAGGLVALCGALTYAEIGSRLPVTGGYYKVFSYAYHPSIAFAINCIILVSNAASGAAIALVGSEYITGVIIPGARDAGYIQTIHISIALAAILLFYVVNMLGLRMSAKTQSILMIIKILLILLLIAPVFFATNNDPSAQLITSNINPAFKEYIKAFGIGLVAVSFTYGGYQQTINFGAEVEKPSRNIPRSIFIGIFIIVVLYLTINYAYVKVIGFETLQHSKNIAAIMASKIFGVNAERILSVLLFLSVLAYINAQLMSNPRVMYAMSEDKILPSAFQKRNRKDALSLALSVFAGIAAIIVFWAKEFDTLLSFSIFLDCFGMVLSAGSIFIIRKRTAHLNGTGIYSMKWFPLMPLIFIAAYSFVAISLLVNETKLSLIGLGVLAGFIILYFVVKGFKPLNKIPDMDLSYIINELGEERENYFNAIAPPIIQTSNFAFRKVDDLKNAFKNEMGGYLYSRGLNPTVDILRKKLAALDGAEDCLIFNNGAAAIFAGIFANVKSGDHIVSVKAPYTWVQRMFDVILPRFSVSTTYIDGTKMENWEEATQPNTTLFYLESPNSWDFVLQDINAVAAFARSKSIITFIDNSYCTPLYQRPIEMGIDLSMQTATKYIGGHSDTLGGVLCGSHAMIKKIFDSEYLNIGSGIQPFNAWLLIRGLRTLPSRIDRITKTTTEVVQFMKQHPKVEAVIFPFDESFSQYQLAKQQMNGACGLFTFVLKTTKMESIVKFCEGLQHIMMAVSWGGHESLVIPKCAGIDPGDFDPTQEHRYIRMYVGLEDPQYLLADLQQALAWVD